MKLLILDGNSVINRAFYGVRALTTQDGLYTNAIFGFLNILEKIEKALIEKGALVPDEVVEGMIESEFKTVTGVNGFLLDGFPRTLPQAAALDAILAKSSEEVTATVSIMIPDEMIMERIKGRALKEGRADDACEETINNRIVTYHNQTEPLIEYYNKSGKYHEIDGIGTIEEVQARIFSVMDKF